jgi:alkylation response protein AidB-like acyl-CoA dehydrogenase
MTSFRLDESQRLLQDTVRRFAREKVAPRAQAIDETAEYPQDMFDALKELGLFSIPFPEKYGGADSVLSACVAVEELGRICYNTAYLLIVQWVPFGAILAGGTEEQKERFLPGLAGGTLRSAISVTEPGAGSDVAGITTRAEKVAGGYKLNGSKFFATNSSIADFVIVAAKTDPTLRHGGISVFILEKGIDGFDIGPSERKLGSRGVPSSPLYLSDCFVPEENRLGPEGEGFALVMEAFNKSRAIIVARGVGLAQGALDLATDYAREREAFARTSPVFRACNGCSPIWPPKLKPPGCWFIKPPPKLTQASRVKSWRRLPPWPSCSLRIWPWKWRRMPYSYLVAPGFRRIIVSNNILEMPRYCRLLKEPIKFNAILLVSMW